MKLDLFEIFLDKMVRWYCDRHAISAEEFYADNDFSKLKIIKLHFFACSTDDQALNLFNRFYAMPLGHVESEVYDSLNSMKNFIVDNEKLTLRAGAFSQPAVNQDSYFTVVRMVENLQMINNGIIDYRPFDLVELSHRWSSWALVFAQAKKSGQFSRPIPKELIEQETKYYVF
ncbi:MAG: hypothetical protein J7577_12100 [Sphingobacteriaceae bacterium]|nr:hypothetical protein [Sphingobacteriaceae bacterium]